MIICRTCSIPMHPIMSFSKDRYEKFNRCSKCFGDTKHRKINDNEFTFGEVLNKAIHKRK